MQQDIIRIVKFLIFIIPCIVFLALAARYTAFTGHLRIEYNFSAQSPSVSAWYPAGRAVDRAKNLRTGEAFQPIVGEPVYMDVQVPRSFDSVDVTMEYKNEEQPLIELGLITSTEPWSVRTAPLESRIISEALDEWDAVTDESGVTLLQRAPTYSTVAEFTQNPPTDKGVATYRTSLIIPYHDPQYTPAPTTTTIERVLRGPHEFVTYIQNEELNITFDLVDINRGFNDDTVTLQLFNATEQLHQEVLPDDGVLDPSGTPSASRSLSLRIPDLPEGAYTIKLITTDDTLITRITTDQEKFVVKNKLFIVNNAEYASSIPNLDTSATTLSTNADKLSIKTDHLTGLQTVMIDDESFAIEKLYNLFTWVSQQQGISTVRTLTLPANDLFIQGTGLYAFTQDQFFDPDYRMEQLDETTQIDQLDFILFRDYKLPTTLSNRNTEQTSHLTLDGVVGDRKKLTFLLSAPGIDRNHFMIQAQRVQFDFYRAPLTARLAEKVRSLF